MRSSTFIQRVTFSIVATIAFFAAPAQAQSIGDVLDFVASSATNIDNATSRSSCSYSKGISHIACQVRNTRFRARQIQQIERRIERQREMARRHNAAVRGDISHASKSQIQLCSWGMREYCRITGMNQQQAKNALARR